MFQIMSRRLVMTKTWKGLKGEVNWPIWMMPLLEKELPPWERVSSYPISTLPEHLHSTSLSYAETTLNSRKLVSFPLIAHYLSAGPPLPPHTSLHRETRPHPHLTIILIFSALDVGRTSGRCHSLCLLRP